MILRFIFCFFILFISLVLVSHVYIYVYFSDEVSFKIRFWFFTFSLDKEKTKVKRSKKAVAENENKNLFKDILNQKGFKGFINFLKEILNTSSFALKKLLEHLVTDKFFVKVIVRSEDSASTAIKYGTVCATIYPLISGLSAFINIKDPKIEVVPDFKNEESSSTEVNFSSRFHLSVFEILMISFSVLKYYLKRKRGFVNE